MNSKKHTTRSTLLAIATFLVLPVFGDAPSTSASFSSGEQAASLLELYTSEGCSSCPPADRWLSQLRDHPELWKSIVPVALHVDYWNYIGWEDRFSDARFTARQQNYIRQGAAGVVYTPGFFSNGAEWRGWRRNRMPSKGTESVGELNVVVDDGAAIIRFQPSQEINSPLLASVAILGMGLETEVRAGGKQGPHASPRFRGAKPAIGKDANRGRTTHCARPAARSGLRRRTARYRHVGNA